MSVERRISARRGSAAGPRLYGRVGPLQFLALGFGTMIGSAWVILMGGWLQSAGPGGAILGLLAGGIVITMVGFLYAELAARVPEVGGEFVYVSRALGSRAGFAVGWFLMLYLVCVVIFEGIALSRLIGVFVPGLGAHVLYTSIGAAVTGEMLVIALLAGGVIVVVNFAGVRTSVALHSALTVGFIAAAGLAIGFLALHADAANARPLLATTDGSPWWAGALGLFAFSGYGLNGFQAIPQLVEERAPNASLRLVGRTIILSIVAGTLFYCIAIAAVAFAAPWQASSAAPLPVLQVIQTLPGGRTVAIVLMVASVGSLLKVWNGIFMMATRLLLAMARAGLLPTWLIAGQDQQADLKRAVVIVAALNLIGVFGGPGAIGPITDMCEMVLTLVYALCCLSVLALRRQSTGDAQFFAPGGPVFLWATMLLSVVLAVGAFAVPLLRSQGGVPLQWQLLMAWGVAGLAVGARLFGPPPAAPRTVS